MSHSFGRNLSLSDSGKVHGASGYGQRITFYYVARKAEIYNIAYVFFGQVFFSVISNWLSPRGRERRERISASAFPRLEMVLVAWRAFLKVLDVLEENELGRVRKSAEVASSSAVPAFPLANSNSWDMAVARCCKTTIMCQSRQVRYTSLHTHHSHTDTHSKVNDFIR